MGGNERPCLSFLHLHLVPERVQSLLPVVLPVLVFASVFAERVGGVGVVLRVVVVHVQIPPQQDCVRNAAVLRDPRVGRGTALEAGRMPRAPGEAERFNG
jgi:hypothetical protein